MWMRSVLLTKYIVQGSRWHSQWLKKTKIGSRKIKLAQTYEKYDFPNTLRLHYNAVLYNADSACSSIMCVKMSADDPVYTMQAVKMVLPVYFLAKFDTS